MALVCTVEIGRAGLGAIPQPLYDRAQGKERQDLILEEVRAGVEDVRISRMMSLQQQGTSTRWEGALERKLTSNDICKAAYQVHDPSCLRHATKPSQPACLGKKANLSLARKGHAGTHPEQLPHNSRRRSLSLATQPGAESGGRDHVQCSVQQQTRQKLEANTLRECWQEATFTANTIDQPSLISIRLGTASWQGQADQVP